MEKKVTCQDLIQGRLDSRLEQLLPDLESMEFEQLGEWATVVGIDFDEGILGYPDSEQAGDELLEACQEQYSDRVCECVLSIERLATYKVLLSTGGPADWFELVYSVDGWRWNGGWYVYQDWFDGARLPITDQQAEALAELWAIYPEAQQ